MKKKRFTCNKKVKHAKKKRKTSGEGTQKTFDASRSRKKVQKEKVSNQLSDLCFFSDCRRSKIILLCHARNLEVFLEQASAEVAVLVLAEAEARFALVAGSALVVKVLQRQAKSLVVFASRAEELVATAVFEETGLSVKRAVDAASVALPHIVVSDEFAPLG